jgi:hypothetical protein
MVIMAAVHSMIAQITTILVTGLLFWNVTCTFRRGIFSFAMSGSSGYPPGMPTVITLYCNPFFHICKQFFCNFEKFFQRQGQNLPNPPEQLPESGKNGPQQQPDTFIKADPAHCQSCCVP